MSYKLNENGYVAFVADSSARRMPGNPNFGHIGMLVSFSNDESCNFKTSINNYIFSMKLLKTILEKLKDIPINIYGLNNGDIFIETCEKCEFIDIAKSLPRDVLLFTVNRETKSAMKLIDEFNVTKKDRHIYVCEFAQGIPTLKQICLQNRPFGQFVYSEDVKVELINDENTSYTASTLSTKKFASFVDMLCGTRWMKNMMIQPILEDECINDEDAPILLTVSGF